MVRAGRPDFKDIDMDYPRRASRVCARLAAGEPLDDICRDDEMPKPDTVRRWMMESPDFYSRYLAAKRVYAERLTDEVLRLADDLPLDAPDAQVRAHRVRIEARKWAVQRLAPRSYVEHPLEPPADGGLTVEIQFGDDGQDAAR